MPVSAKTITPTAIPARLDATSQPRPSMSELPIAMTRPTMPRASAYAPKTITSEYRLMPGQMMMTTPSARERAPLMPIAHRSFVSCVSTVCRASSSMVSISRDLLSCVDDWTLRLASGRRIGESADRVRKLRTAPAGVRGSRNGSARSPMSAGRDSATVAPCFRSPTGSRRAASRS